MSQWPLYGKKHLEKWRNYRILKSKLELHLVKATSPHDEALRKFIQTVGPVQYLTKIEGTTNELFHIIVWHKYNV